MKLVASFPKYAFGCSSPVDANLIFSFLRGVQGFTLTDLRVHSAALASGVLSSSLTEGSSSVVPSAKFIWESERASMKANEVPVPLYAEEDRKNFLLAVSVTSEKNADASAFVTCGAALSAQ